MFRVFSSCFGLRIGSHKMKIGGNIDGGRKKAAGGGK